MVAYPSNRISNVMSTSIKWISIKDQFEFQKEIKLNEWI